MPHQLVATANIILQGRACLNTLTLLLTIKVFTAHEFYEYSGLYITLQLHHLLHHQLNCVEVKGILTIHDNFKKN